MNNTIDKQIESILRQSVASLFVDVNLPTITISRPTAEAHGDYSTNLALALAAQLKRPALEVAEALAAAITLPDWLAKIEAVAPGFINFHLSESYLSTNLDSLLSNPQGYCRPAHLGKEIIFEYGQPNTHKLPHLGHLYSFCYGESCVRLLSAAGHEIKRLNYQGDVGLHVAKCLWAVQGTSDRPSPTDSLASKADFLQECYQRGSAAYEEDGQAKIAIDELNRAIYRRDPAVMPLWQETRGWSVDYYQQFNSRLGIKFDRNYYESEVSGQAVEIVKQNTGRFFIEDQGAVIFPGDQYGLHRRVFLNQAGNPTYEAKDIALAAAKRADWSYDRSVTATASEQNDYWRVIIKTIELLYPDQTGKVEHIGFGMINLSSGKMSSRTGNIVSAIGLVDEVKSRVAEYITSNRDYSAEERESIAELVAQAAVKYSFLKSSPEKNMTFDIDSSIAFEGNSGPYLLYTYARCQSLLAKGAADRTLQSTDRPKANSEEMAILRYLERYPAEVQTAASQLAPHVIATYLYELAQRFSYFYNQHQVIVGDAAVCQFRLALAEATARVLNDGLDLLGIKTAPRV